MTDIKAAELPLGTIVATPSEAWLKASKLWSLDRPNWKCTDRQSYRDDEIDELLTDVRYERAVVLRHGYNGEGES